MNISLSKYELLKYIEAQVECHFPDKYKFKGVDVEQALDLALDRTEFCFKHITLNGYTDEKGNSYFSHLHSDQYSQFLYFLSNSLWKLSENKVLCDKIIFLNKTLNGMFYSYKGKLPDIFLFAHPVGTILGNAAYSDFLVVFQNVTVNTSVDSNKNTAPQLGKGLFLGAGAKVIGNKPIGDRVSLGVDALIYNVEVPNDYVALNIDGKTSLQQRKKESCMAQQYFNVPII